MSNVCEFVQYFFSNSYALAFILEIGQSVSKLVEGQKKKKQKRYFLDGIKKKVKAMKKSHLFRSKRCIELLLVGEETVDAEDEAVVYHTIREL